MALRRHRPPVRAQSGQALVFVLGFLAVLVAVFLGAADLGRATADRQRLVNAADAAAYGGAVWQARTLNAQAYMNRAVVANEVAVAQAVSLRAWSDYVAQTLNNVRTVTSWIPYVNSVTSAIASTWRGVDRTVQTTGRVVETTASTVSTILGRAQLAVHAAGAAGVVDVARETLRAHGADVEPSAEGARLTARNAFEWARFTTDYSGSRRDRLRATVLDARDGFSARRSHRFAPMPASLVARIEKRGGTDLLGYDVWRGLDTLSVHQRSLFGGFRERIPLGWGGAEAGNGRARGQGDHDGAWRVNSTAARYADRELNSRGRNGGYRGLPPNRDLREPQRQDERVLEFVVEAERRGAAGAPRSRALAAAAVSFERPEPRADGRREYPSLYSPYWQPRLVPVSRDHRLLVRGFRDPYAAVAP